MKNLKIKIIIVIHLSLLLVECGVKGVPLPPDDPAPIFNKNMPKPMSSPTQKNEIDSNLEKK